MNKTAIAAQPELVDDVAIEDLADTSAGGWCVGSAGTFGCPSSFGSYGTAS